jgi:hypothetical protein
MPTTEHDFLSANPHVDVLVDFNDEMDHQLVAVQSDFRQGLSPQAGDVFVAGCWGAAAAKVQVMEVSGELVRLRVLD